MPLDVKLINDIYYTEDFKVMIRSNKEYLVANALEFPLIDRALVSAHRYDFYSILRITGQDKINPMLYWVIAFINGILNPEQDVIDMKSYLYVDETVINQMLARQNTERK